MSGEIKLTSIL